MNSSESRGQEHNLATPDRKKPQVVIVNAMQSVPAVCPDSLRLPDS
jgi:hypothetical protein